jgi:hypothetical protein
VREGGSEIINSHLDPQNSELSISVQGVPNGMYMIHILGKNDELIFRERMIIE